INGGEFDFAGAGSITNLVFGGTGFVSDPWAFFKGGTTDSNVSFSGTAVADLSHPGRYTMPLSTSLTVSAGDDTPFSVVLYPGSSGELFWLENDSDSVFAGALAPLGSLTGIPAASAPAGTERTRK
ncbi:MAG TPA: hypothetical protein VND65_23070, partial [Candidatus Binatia bacterium]|nr:hypothetical protein [Candidatus Binatia bacterium]